MSRGATPAPPAPARPAPAVVIRDDHAGPARLGKGPDEVHRILRLPVLLEPVVEGKGSRERGHFLADQFLLLGQLKVHARDCSVTPAPAPLACAGYTARRRTPDGAQIKSGSG